MTDKSGKSTSSTTSTGKTHAAGSLSGRGSGKDKAAFLARSMIEQAMKDALLMDGTADDAADAVKWIRDSKNFPPLAQSCGMDPDAVRQLLLHAITLDPVQKRRVYDDFVLLGQG